MILLVALGGALGSVLRYLWVTAATGLLGDAFPYGTLGVNALGSFLAGALYVALIERYGAAPEWRGLLVVGVLGGFTTFSAFSVDTIRLLEESGLNMALGNIAANLVLGLLACWAAVWLARQWL